MEENDLLLQFRIVARLVMLIRIGRPGESKVLTQLEAMVEVKFATSILLGCDHESLTPASRVRHQPAFSVSVQRILPRFIGEV